MRPIPDKLRKQLSEDPYYKQCCLTGKKNEKIEWHHNLIFGGRQVNARFCILPLSQSVHNQITKYKELCDWVMWNRASESEITEFSKAVNVRHKLNYLNGKFGKKYTEGDTRVFEFAEDISLQE